MKPKSNAGSEESGLSKIFVDFISIWRWRIETLNGLPEGFDIPKMPEAPHEYAQGPNKVLKDKAI
ncbi:MAG TPA: hypothetical protein VFY50_02575 [Candidatus Nitrosocosmicus sp.]|nr:hypothetical protein [Candidatus Nitrosocosmicus sp.]